MNARFAACSTMPRALGGTPAMACWAPPEATASLTRFTVPCGNDSPASSDPSRSVNCDWKIAPSPAMPVAMPTWRKVLLMPEAMPLRRGRTTPTAVEASGGFDEADPDAGEQEAGEQRGPARVGVDAAHQQQPDADEQQPAAEQHAHRHPRPRAGRRSARRRTTAA